MVEDILRVKVDNYKLLTLLVLTDLCFIFVHFILVYHAELGSYTLLSIEKDHGIAEIFQYVKEFWIFLMLLWLAVRVRSSLFFGWSLLFLYILLDDSLSLHEYHGRAIADYFDLQPIIGVRAIDLGVLSYWLIIGIVLILYIGFYHYLSKQKFREFSWNLALLFAGLVFFGLFVDAIHSMFMNPIIFNVITLIEEGGEMILMSVITWYVFNIDQKDLVQPITE